MRSWRLIPVFGWLVLMLAAVPAWAASVWTEPAAAFAERIADKVGAGAAITFTLRNVSSLSAAEVADARAQILAQLQAQGMRVVPESRAEAAVAVTLSENAEGYLWIAETTQSRSNSAMVMLRVARLQTTAAAHTGHSLALTKMLLWSQPDGERVLDAAVLDAGGSTTRLVLTPSRVTLYGMQGSQWQQQLSLPLPQAAGSVSRDPRGRLLLRRDHLFDVYLPGRRCGSGSRGAQLTVNCVQSDDPWPLADADGLQAFYAPARNFFNGTLAGLRAAGKSVSPFFTAAKVDENGTELWLLAGVDGRIRLFNGVNETTATFGNWGSDIASVKSGCDAGWQVLATRPGDVTETDAVQAYEIVARQAVAVSDPLELPGPVTALWSGENDATAVVRNLKTQRYEAYSLSVDCGR